MKTNYGCLSLEELIELLLDYSHNSDNVHLVICEDCMSKYQGLQLSFTIAREQNKTVSNEDFKIQRIKEIEKLIILYGEESRAVDMAIKTGLGFQQAQMIFNDLGFDQKEF